MPNNITLKKSSVVDKVPLPGDLQFGELALNYADGNLFYKNSSNVITTLASNKFVTVSGNVTGNYFIGNGSLLTGITATSATTAATVTANAQPNITSVGILSSLVASGNISAANVIATLHGSGANVTSISATNISSGTLNAARLSGTYTITVSGSATTAGTVTTAAQPNITSVGTLSSLAVTGNTTSGNFVGTLNGSGANVTSINATNISSGTLAAARLSGTYTITVSGSATTAGTVTTAAQPNITSVGTLSSLIVSGNIAGANINGNGSGLGSINGSNVDGFVSNAVFATAAGSATTATSATTAATVTTAAQPNITSVGTLTSLTATGNVALNLAAPQTLAVAATTTQTTDMVTIVGNTITAGVNALYVGFTGGAAAVEASAMRIDLTPGGTSGGTWSGLRLTQGATTASGVTVNVIKADNITAGAGSDHILYAGTGYDSIINYNGTTVINGSGQVIGGRVTGTVPSATTAGTVTTAAQPNITSVGNLTGANIATANITNGTGAISTATGALKISGGAGITGNVYAGAFYGAATGLTSIPGANVTGIVPVATSATTAGTVTTAAQPNITSVGTLSSLAVTGNTTSGNFVGTLNGSGANVTSINATNISSGTLAAARLSGTYTITVSGSATTAGTVTTAAQPNITSVGTLSSLAVTGNTTSGNFTTAGLVNTGTLQTSGNAIVGGNLIVNGNTVSVNIQSLTVQDPIIGLGRGANNAPLTTNDGKDRGTEMWYYDTAERAAFVGYDNSTGKLIAASNVSIVDEIVSVNSYGTFVVGSVEAALISATGNITGANINGNGSGLSSITGANVTGTVANATFATSAGSATSATSATTAGTVTTAAQPNITSVGTLSSLAVTGNTTSGNFVGTLNGSGANVTSINATNISSGTLAAARLSGTYTITVSGSATTAGTVTTATQPNITGVGTLTSGTWNANTIAVARGGTGATAATAAFANLNGYTSTATAAGTTTLTNTSSRYQLFTGTSTQTITLPVTSTLATGWEFKIVNNSTGSLTVNSSGGNLVVTIVAGMTVVLTCINTGVTTAAGWEQDITGSDSYTGTGSLVLSAGPTLTGTVTAGTFSGSGASLTSLNGSNISSGTIPSGRLSGSYSISVTSATTAGTVTTAAQPNITSVGTMATATITTLSTAGITKTGSNGVGNIGAAASTFNTVFAKATSAQYADLAENYLADADYEPGTVLVFGGPQEVTVSLIPDSTRIAGVVSTNPAHLMNAELAGKHVAAIALIGRVPTKVVGQVNKGDFMVSAGNGCARACAEPKLGTVIGKAVQDFSGESGTIEILINNM